jgi:hypothetical protein
MGSIDAALEYVKLDNTGRIRDMTGTMKADVPIASRVFTDTMETSQRTLDGATMGALVSSSKLSLLRWYCFPKYKNTGSTGDSFTIKLGDRMVEAGSGRRLGDGENCAFKLWCAMQ